MSEDPREKMSERLKALGDRIEGHKKTVSGPSEEEPARSGFSAAMKMSTEFIVSVVVGVALGYGLDQWTGMSPLFMILLLILGFGAGVMSIMRSAGMIAQPDIYKSREQRGSGKDK